LLLMGFFMFLGLLLGGAGWYVYVRTPSWVLTGPPSFMNPIIKMIREPNDLFGILTLSKLRDYSLIVAIIGTILFVLPLILRSRR
jgi:hypothetical protein